jgi:hypothetical protein
LQWVQRVRLPAVRQCVVEHIRNMAPACCIAMVRVATAQRGATATCRNRSRCTVERLQLFRTVQRRRGLRAAARAAAARRRQPRDRRARQHRCAAVFGDVWLPGETAAAKQTSKPQANQQFKRTGEGGLSLGFGERRAADLRCAGALAVTSAGEELTALGEHLARLPLDARLGKV